MSDHKKKLLQKKQSQHSPPPEEHTNTQPTYGTEKTTKLKTYNKTLHHPTALSRRTRGTKLTNSVRSDNEKKKKKKKTIPQFRRRRQKQQKRKPTLTKTPHFHMEQKMNT